MLAISVGPQEIIIVLLIALLLFGAKRLPEIGKGLGKGIREFRDATKGLSDDVREGLGEGDPRQHQASPPQYQQPAPPPPQAPPPGEGNRPSGQ